MSLSYHDTNRLPNWARVEWHRDEYSYESEVWFGIRCADGNVGLKIGMPEEFGQRSVTRRKVLQDMIEQLTIQLATITLEEK
ncbi:hypothetical protein UFOVP232_71 [uncultured Caudovirales phage]|jgi:hypothetical protein|uniref:Uncharacterized protein n=1 Tax=uncultured Caudovirales phage TaxID=2100421 RepID=A0A6J7WQ39_9CAUD|nr:hypothetical protein UFOVP232_71 [uncultured Caudovirales phage]